MGKDWRSLHITQSVRRLCMPLIIQSDHTSKGMDKINYIIVEQPEEIRKIETPLSVKWRRRWRRARKAEK